jgi:hypothetical protein
VPGLPLGGDGFDAALDGPVLVDADMADTGEVNADDFGVRHGVPAGARSLRRPFDGVPPAAPLEPGVARFPPGLHSVEEALERAVQAADRRPLAAEGPTAVLLGVGQPDPLQLRVLAVEGEPVAAHPPRLAPLFERGVVELAGVFQARAQRGLLILGGSQPELVGPPHCSVSNGRRRMPAIGSSQSTVQSASIHDRVGNRSRAYPQIRSSTCTSSPPVPIQDTLNEFNI